MTQVTPQPADHVVVEADAIVERLRRGESNWAQTPLSRRIEMLGEFADLVAQHADEWVALAAEMKQLGPESPLVGEEWISGPWAVISYAHALAQSLTLLEQGQSVLSGRSVRAVPGGRIGIEVLPSNTFEKLLLNGFSAEVWMQAGITADEVRATAGLGQRAPADTQGTALVLGAGNITSIAPTDVLYILFADNRIAVLNLNPIADRLIGVFTRIFAPFLEIGAVEIQSAGVPLGSALASHPGITAVHMTGSEATHDAIVWGPGAQGIANKAAGAPLLTKPISSELGGVSPVIIVPGKWSRADLRFQAQHVATMRLHNSGCNCVAGQLVVLSSDWGQKDQFLTELRTALREAPARPAWYPGCEARVAAARRDRPSAEAVGGTPERTLITGLDLANADDPAFRDEYFGPVLGVAELSGTASEFLAAAVDAANTKLRGSLGANILVHPSTVRGLGGELDEQIARLRYGTIAVNCWTGVGYLTGNATWGAFPGHRLDDIQSGRGVVHNALLLDGVERTVVRGPFRPLHRSIVHGEWSISPKPPWFVNNRTAATTGRLLTDFAARPRWSALPGIFASALRG